MHITWRTSLWQQFGAAIDMLEDTIRLCPDHLWTTVVWKDPDDVRYGHYWFIASHTLVWLDLYLTGAEQDFAPPPPFIRGVLPDQPYTKEQVLAYLRQCRSKCQSTIEALTEEHAYRHQHYEWMQGSFLELQLYSMRHVQEHASQLNLVLGQHDVPGLDWVPIARDVAI